MRLRPLALVLFAAVAAGPLVVASRAAPADDPLAAMTADDHVNLERNLRWMLARARDEAARHARKEAVPPARVGVYADAGAWHPSVRSVAEAFEGAGVRCRGLDRTSLSSEGLAGLEALVFPGGWAPFQAASLGSRGVDAIRAFVEGGGRVLGICAGGYLFAKDVRWDGANYPYPFGFFDGTADGPVVGLAAWPERGSVLLTIDAAGKARGLTPFAKAEVLYYGGARFVGGSGVTTLARYPDGTPAAVARRVGRGEVVLVGAHLERPPPAAGGDDAPAPAAAGQAFVALLLGKR